MTYNNDVLRFITIVYKNITARLQRKNSAVMSLLLKNVRQVRQRHVARTKHQDLGFRRIRLTQVQFDPIPGLMMLCVIVVVGKETLRGCRLAVGG